MFRSLRSRIAFLYVGLILLAMAILAIYMLNLMRTSYLTHLEERMITEAQLVGDALISLTDQKEPSKAFAPQVQHYADRLQMRITVIAPDGTVMADSEEDAARMDNHLNRPEVKEALAGEHSSEVRFSQTLGREMMYVAVPLKKGEQVQAILRLALPLDQVEAHLAPLRRALLVATIAASTLALAMAIVIAELSARPVRQLIRAADRLARGDLNARLIPTTQDEVGSLTQAFNRMAQQLQEQIEALISERSQMAAVLEHMADGVIITDKEGCVRLINPAAARILSISEEAALGRTFAQLVRNAQLTELFRQCRAKGEEQIGAAELDRKGPFVQSIITPLSKTSPHAFLVILQDLTRVRQLEMVRRDFISNISHELRTPLTSLKALVDTLREGALKDPPAAERFLDGIDRQIDALTHMIQELLELSRIESGQAPLRLTPAPVSDVVLPPVEILLPQAERSGIQLKVDLPPNLPQVLADTERIQQVVSNLVHNAIKFTPSGGSVTVSGKLSQNEVIVSVSDTGVGIPASALPRIFERFYKADRSRSGGGTGLGLAIAKHIVQSHGGRIWAESIEGEGSTFFFSLPISEANHR